jgi:acyl dehydratase
MVVQPQGRVDRDGSGQRTRFEDIEVGADLGTLDWSVQPENVAGLQENDLDYHEWYVDSSPFGGAIVPPLATYPPVRVLFTRNYNLRGLFIEFESEFRRPIFFGERLTISGRVADKFIKRDREYVTYEAEGRDEKGEIVFTTRRTHVLDFLTRSVPRTAEGIDSGLVTK